MKMKMTMWCEIPDDDKSQCDFNMALSEKLWDLKDDGWDISFPVVVHEIKEAE